MHQSWREISYGTCITHWENMIRIIFATEPAWIFPKAHLKSSQDSLIGHPSSSNYQEEYTRDARNCFLEIPLPLTVPFLSWSGGNNACQTCSVWRAFPDLPHQNPTVEADSRTVEARVKQIKYLWSELASSVVHELARIRNVKGDVHGNRKMIKKWYNRKVMKNPIHNHI